MKNYLPAWIIDAIQKDQDDKTIQPEQLQLPLYYPELEKDDNKDKPKQVIIEF